MPDQTIICPSCKSAIPLTEAHSQQAKQIEAELEAKLNAQHAAQVKSFAEKEKAFALEQEKIAQAQKEMLEAKQKLADQSKELETQVQSKVKAQLESELIQEKKKIWAIAQQKAAEQNKQQLTDLETQVVESRTKLELAEKQELDLRRRARELEEQQRKIELELARKLDEERGKIEENARRLEADAQRLKLQEKDKQLEIMNKTIEDLRRQSKQGSMQIQGEVQEDGLKHLLNESFPLDVVSDVATGARGADLLQVVNGKVNSSGGKILWESKNTKAFSESWLSKLKSDQGSVKADVAILVTQALPDGVTTFCQKNGIWIVSYELAVPLAFTLRFHLAEVSKVKLSLDGREEKSQLLYGYLSSAQFKNRIENLVMAFIGMKQDLETEKRSFQRLWSKREKEIEKMFGSTANLYGDLQGIIGGALPTIPQLELPGAEMGLLEETSGETADTRDSGDIEDSQDTGATREAGDSQMVGKNKETPALLNGGLFDAGESV
jgi:hypothetical protein